MTQDKEDICVPVALRNVEVHGPQQVQFLLHLIGSHSHEQVKLEAGKTLDHFTLLDLAEQK